MSALEEFMQNECVNSKTNRNKRYYYIKLTDDFFRQKEIKKLRRIPGGDTYTIIYQKMLLRSIKDDWKLYYDGVEEDFASELAYDIDEDVEAVKVTIQFLIANHVLYQNNPDEYELIGAQCMVGTETDAAQRMRKMRDRKRLESGEQNLLEGS